MNSDKLKVIKNIKGIDSYSKNPIIDSLIKQKLQSQMASVKQNFNEIITREENKPKDTNKNVRNIKKRTLSVQDLAGITPERIRQSVNYRPTNGEARAFVQQRQYSSPFQEIEGIQEINKARTDRENFFIKIKEEDKRILENHQSDPNFYKSLQDKVKNKLPSDLWLPSQAEVDQIISSRVQRVQTQMKVHQSEHFDLKVTDRPSSQGFTPLKINRKAAKMSPVHRGKSSQITYDPKKYHKNDYNSLQKWLQIAIDCVNSQASSKNISDNGTSKNELLVKQHLNQIYTIYMCVLKEIIRLTYIQSAQKGLILQKIIWSLIRLFEELIQEQHKANYEEFKYFSKEQKQQKELYENRMKKLEKKLSETQEILEKYYKDKAKIVLTGLTYRNVNQQMSKQINELTNSVASLKKQNEFLMSKMLNMVRQFELKSIIRVKSTEEHLQYFYLNAAGKIQTVAKAPKTQTLEAHFKKQMLRHSTSSLSLNPQHPINVIENTLNSYWQKKKSFLGIEELVKKYFTCQVRDEGTQADGKGPGDWKDMAVQCPPEGEESFQVFLKRQLDEQRDKWSNKEKQYQTTQVTLKDLFSQMKESIDILTHQNANYKSTLDQKDFQINFQNKKIQNIEQKNTLLLKKISQLQSQRDSLVQQKQKIQGQIQKLKDKLGEEKRKFMYEKENNNILVSNIYQCKQKNQQLRQQFQQLQDKIRQVAPFLQQTIAMPQAAEVRTLVNLAAVVQKYLSEYVEKDAKVFLTR